MREPRVRRTSPWWVRELTSESLHRLGGRLDSKYRGDGLSARERYLLAKLENELAWRALRAAGPDKCTCRFCSYGFDDVWGGQEDDPGGAGPPS